MYLVSAELRNFCQHKERVVEFARGLTAVIGSNGSGKTNLMRGVYACLTNDFSRFGGIKGDNISQLSTDSTDQSFIQLTVSHGGVPCAIKRGLRPVSKSMDINGHVIRKEAEIAKIVEGWFQLPLKVVGEYMFVDQSRLTDFIDIVPAERLKAMHRLFRLDKAESRYNEIGDFINKNTVRFLPDRTRESAAAQLEDQQRKLSEAQTKLAGHRIWPDGMELKLHDLVMAFKTKTQAIESKVFLSKRIAAEVLSIIEAEESLKSIQDDIDVVSRYLDEGGLQLATTDLQICRLHAASQQSLESTRSRLKLMEDTPPAHPTRARQSWSDVNENYLVSIADELSRINTIVSAFDPSGIGECPTCHTPASVLKGRYDEFVNKQATLTKSYRNSLESKKTILAIDDEHREYQQKIGVYESTKQGLIEHINRVEASLPTLPSRTENELISYIEDHNSTRAVIQKLEDEYKKIESELAIHKGTEAGLNQQLMIVNDQLSKLPITEEEAGLAAAQLPIIAEDNKCRTELSTQVEVLKSSVAALEKQLAKSDQDAARHDKWKILKQDLEQVRSILHRDALPLLVAQSNLELLEDDVNKCLEDLGVDFRVDVSKSLSFRVKFPDGRDIPAERLSGGERVVFALAWRLAVNAAFASEVGILCLDEPTAGLDSDRLDCLKRALERMRWMAGERGLQCIIVTHERSLMPLFDHVIDLTARG